MLCQFRCNWCVMLVYLNTHVMDYWCQSVALKCDTIGKVHAVVSGSCTGQLRPTSLNSDCFDIYVLLEDHSDCHPCQCSPFGSSAPKYLLLAILQVSSWPPDLLLVLLVPVGHTGLQMVPAVDRTFTEWSTMSFWSAVVMTVQKCSICYHRAAWICSAPYIYNTLL